MLHYTTTHKSLKEEKASKKLELIIIITYADPESYEKEQ